MPWPAKRRLWSKEEREKTLQTLQKEMMEKQVAASKEAAAKNAAEGEKFLAENKKKDGVKTTASGLQYKVLKEGSGPTPKETDTVVTNYKGTLLDGTEFDSSYKRNEPATFPVNRVIKGWTEALQLMKPGAKYQLFVPASRLWRARGGQGYWSECDADFRGGTAQHQAAGTRGHLSPPARRGHRPRPRRPRNQCLRHPHLSLPLQPNHLRRRRQSRSKNARRVSFLDAVPLAPRPGEGRRPTSLPGCRTRVFRDEKRAR